MSDMWEPHRAELVREGNALVCDVCKRVVIANIGEAKK